MHNVWCPLLFYCKLTERGLSDKTDSVFEARVTWRSLKDPLTNVLEHVQPSLEIATINRHSHDWTSLL